METASSGGAGLASSYADSIDSLSPRSRGAESWDEPFGSSPAAAQPSLKLRLMCSYGGQIMPRPHDRMLCYLGGETRIVVVDRHSNLADLHARLSRSLMGGHPFSLKYQLPSEDLDSLISVTTDEDLDNMVEEYDRVAAAGGKASRLRLFLFPAKPDSTGGPPSSSSMGSLLDDSKSETWFVDALNSAILGNGLPSADSAASSVNCLLGLDDSSSSKRSPAGPGEDAGGASMPPESENETVFPRRDSSGKLGGSSRRGGQDSNSAPESPMLGTASSFGSASSAPSISNLPPIRVRPDDRGPDPRAVEEHFAHMNISDQQQQQPQQQLVDVEVFNPQPQHYPLPVTAAATTAAIPSNVSPTEKPIPSRVFSSDDDRSDHGDVQRTSPQLPQQQRQQPQYQQQRQQPQYQYQYQQQQQQQQQQPQQQIPNVRDLALPGEAASRSMYYQERPPLASDPRQEVPQYDPGFRMQPVQVTEKGYLLQQPPPAQQPVQAADLRQPQQQQIQQQFVQGSPHLVHHHASGTVLPINPYYQMPIHPQQHLPQAAHHPYNPQMPMYSLPVQQNPAYSLPVPQNLGDAKPLSNAVLPSGVTPPPPKPELAANVYRAGVGIGVTTAPSVAQQLQQAQFIHLADPSHQYVGYHSMPHQQPQSAPMPAAGYGYEYADVARPQQMYYAQAAPAALHPQYQAVSSGQVMTEAPVALHQPADPKQTKAS